MKEDGTKRIYFPELDVLRFISAAIVALAHAYIGYWMWYRAGEDRIDNVGPTFDRFMENLGIGVDAFFFMSGFLITFILLKERLTHGKISIKNFFIRRGLRIWPLYYFLILITPLLVMWLDIPDPNYTTTALFYNNFDAISTGQWIYPFEHFWSICVEEHFYLIWPFIIAFTPIKHLKWVFLGLIAVSVGFRFWAYNHAEHQWFTLYLHSLGRMDTLVIGGLIALIHVRKGIQLNLPRFTGVLATGILVVLLCTEVTNSWDSAFIAGTKRLAYSILIGFIVMFQLFNQQTIFNFRKPGVFHYLGKISYGIYMYSNMLIPIIAEKVLTNDAVKNVWMYSLAFVGMSIVIPIISYELMEKPLLRLKDRFAIIKTRRY